jgi:hypothetical protein
VAGGVDRAREQHEHEQHAPRQCGTGGPWCVVTKWKFFVTIVHAILRILAAKGLRLLLGAPTGRAAKRLNEPTGPAVGYLAPKY